MVNRRVSVVFVTASFLMGLFPAVSSFGITSSRAACNSVYMSATGEPISPMSATPLCDLQTFLRLTDQVSTGGAAKVAIQSGTCLLNGLVETRRAKKLFVGDLVKLQNGQSLDVKNEVVMRGYVFTTKAKKEKPLPTVDADGNKEFGGRYRSDEWRAERKQKKSERKGQKRTKKDEEE